MSNFTELQKAQLMNDALLVQLRNAETAIGSARHKLDAFSRILDLCNRIPTHGFITRERCCNQFC